MSPFSYLNRFFQISQFAPDFWGFFDEILANFWKKLKISPKKPQKSGENENFQKRIYRILHTDGMKVCTNFGDYPITLLRVLGNGDEFFDPFFQYGDSYTFRDISRKVPCSRHHRISTRQAF
jgi:hypothetical protein